MKLIDRRTIAIVVCMVSICFITLGVRNQMLDDDHGTKHRPGTVVANVQKAAVTDVARQESHLVKHAPAEAPCAVATVPSADIPTWDQFHPHSSSSRAPPRISLS